MCSHMALSWHQCEPNVKRVSVLGPMGRLGLQDRFTDAPRLPPVFCAGCFAKETEAPLYKKKLNSLGTFAVGKASGTKERLRRCEGEVSCRRVSHEI